MSARHDEVFRQVRREHDDVISALKASKGKKKGAPGVPSYDPVRLESAIATAGDAYSLLLIATAEAFLREYLTTLGIAIGDEPKLATLIDKSVKELNGRATGTLIRLDEKRPMHELRIRRNFYAHGHGRSVFPSVPNVEATISRFLSQFP